MIAADAMIAVFFNLRVPPVRVRKDWGEFRAQKNGHFSRSFERDNMLMIWKHSRICILQPRMFMVVDVLIKGLL